MYNQGQHAIVFMEVLSMNEALKDSAQNSQIE